MKDLDFKLRERFEKREYEGDRYGETRLDKLLMKKYEKEKKKSYQRYLRSDNNAE